MYSYDGRKKGQAMMATCLERVWWSGQERKNTLSRTTFVHTSPGTPPAYYLP